MNVDCRHLKFLNCTAAFTALKNDVLSKENCASKAFKRLQQKTACYFCSSSKPIDFRTEDWTFHAFIFHFYDLSHVLFGQCKTLQATGVARKDYIALEF